MKLEKKWLGYLFLPLSFLFFFVVFTFWNLRHGIGRDEGADQHWFKGNLHVHTDRADGDATSAEVVDWYLENGYDFLAITDHDLRFDKPRLVRRWGQKMLVMAGQEVTVGKNFNPTIHMGAVHTQFPISSDLGALNGNRKEGLKRSFLKRGLSPEMSEAAMMVFELRDRIKALNTEIEGQGALAILNHPAMSVDLSLLKQLDQLPLFIELWNPHESKRYANGKQPPDTEEMWDALLSQGRKMYAVTGDDAHHFKRLDGSPPGKVWVWVKAKKLSPEAIVAAVKRGDSYVSTGIKLKRVEWLKQQKQLVVEVDEKPGQRYSIRFIGKDGTVLQQTNASQAVYPVKGDELYVRVKVLDSAMLKACTQPFFISRET